MFKVYKARRRRTFFEITRNFIENDALRCAKHVDTRKKVTQKGAAPLLSLSALLMPLTMSLSALLSGENFVPTPREFDENFVPTPGEFDENVVPTPGDFKSIREGGTQWTRIERSIMGAQASMSFLTFLDKRL